MADLRTKTMAALRPAAQTRMDNANVNYEADQALQASTSSELAKGWTSAGLSEKGNAILDQANNAYRNGDAVTGKALEAEGVRTLEQARVWSPSVQRASDIDGLGSAARWGMGALASGVRSTLPPMAGALVGGALGGLATRSIRGAQLGAGALATVAGYDQMANETIGWAMMDPGIRANKSMQEIKGTGRVSGAVQAPLEALVPGLMGGAAMGLAKGLGRAGVKQAAAAGLAGGAVTEAGTEFAQDLVGQGAMNSLRDKPLTQDLDYKQALDSAAAGAVAGGGMGLAGGAMQGLHNRGAGAVDAVGDAVANPGSLLDKGAVLAGDAAGKIMNAAEGVGGKVKGKINSTLDEFIASRVVDPDRHALIAPMTEEESNLSGQELVDRFKPKAQAWASKVLQNPSAYDEEDVADATEFGKTNDPFLLQSKLRNRMGAKAGRKADEAIADELNPKVKSSKLRSNSSVFGLHRKGDPFDGEDLIDGVPSQAQPAIDHISDSGFGHPSAGEYSGAPTYSTNEKPERINGLVPVEQQAEMTDRQGLARKILNEGGRASAEQTKKEWDESTRLLAKIWSKQGIDEGIIQKVEGEDDPIKQNAAIAVMSWVQRGFKGTDGEVIIPEQMIRAYGAKQTGKLVKNAYDLAVSQGVIDDTAEQTFDEVQARVKELGQAHETDVAAVIDNLTPIAREKIVNALSYRDKASAKEHAFDLAKDIRSIVQSKSVEQHTGFLRELFGPKMNDVLDHFQPGEEAAPSRNVIDEEKASFEDGNDNRDEYDPSINEVDGDVESKTKYVNQSKTNEYFDMHDELHRGRFDEEIGKQSNPDTRVSKVGLVDREIEKVEAEKGETLPPSERFEVMKRIVKDRLGLTAPARLPDDAGPDQTKAHAKAVEDYERRVRSAATQLNKQYKAMRVATEKLAAPRVNFTPEQVNNLHHKNLDHRGPKATIQHGALFFDRGGNKTPYVTSTHAILREMFQVKDGSQESTTEDFGGDAASRMQLLKQGIASLLTGGDFARVGYVKYAGAKPTWMRSNSRLPGDLTIGRRGEAPITVREAEEQEASKFTPEMATGQGGEVAMPKKASAETKKALNALPSDPATLGGTQYETVRAQSTKEIAFKLGELLKENGANMTKDVRGDIVKATKRFWNLEKRGEVAAGYTAERINAEVDALGLELGFDITTVRTRVESRSMEPDDIVPSEKSLGMYESETSRREDDPKTMGPDGKAINRDERGFINSGNATMVAANMAGSESTVTGKPDPKEGGTKPLPRRNGVGSVVPSEPATRMSILDPEGVIAKATEAFEAPHFDPSERSVLTHLNFLIRRAKEAGSDLIGPLTDLADKIGATEARQDVSNAKGLTDTQATFVRGLLNASPLARAVIDHIGFIGVFGKPRMATNSKGEQVEINGRSVRGANGSVVLLNPGLFGKPMKAIRVLYHEMAHTIQHIVDLTEFAMDGKLHQLAKALPEDSATRAELANPLKSPYTGDRFARELHAQLFALFAGKRSNETLLSESPELHAEMERMYGDDGFGSGSHLARFTGRGRGLDKSQRQGNGADGAQAKVASRNDAEGGRSGTNSGRTGDQSTDRKLAEGVRGEVTPEVAKVEAWAIRAFRKGGAYMKQAFAEMNPEQMQRARDVIGSMLPVTKENPFWARNEIQEEEGFFDDRIAKVKGWLDRKTKSSKAKADTDSKGAARLSDQDAQGKGVTVVEHPSSGYRDRTKHNADSAGATVAIATDFDTAGEKLTKRLAGDKIVQIPIAKTPASAAKALIAHMQALGVTTLNVAGNGIYTLNEKLGVTQAQVNQYIYDTLKAAHLVVGITKIVTGGQTGVDIAGAIAAKRLGIPVDVTMPKGFLQRDMHGKDFTQTKEKVVAQIEDGARSLVDKDPVVKSSKVSTLADKRAEKLKAKAQGIMDSMSDEDIAVLQNDITNYDWGKGLKIPSVLKDSFDAWMSDYRGGEGEGMMAHENRDATIERFLEDVAGDPINYEPAEVAMALHILAGGSIASASKAKADSKTLTEASPEVQAAKDHILKTVGDKIGLKFIKAFLDGKSGEHRMGPAGQENVISIALNSDVLGTAYHESIHEFFSMLTNGAATATKEVLLRAGKNKRLLREVSRLLDGHPEAQAQLGDPEEALAYIYQFWKAGALKIGPDTKTMFQKVSEYFRNVLGLVSDEMREQQDLLNADKILTAFDQGAYGNETIRAGMMAAVNADVERQDAALKAVGEKWTTIVNKVGKLALPAEQVIEASGNKRLIKILRDFNQKTGDAMDGKASFFEAVSASRNKFMLRLENVMAKADKKDLELARQHLVKGTDPSDPVVTSIVLKTREVLDDLYKFAAERQVARWDSETHEWVGLEYRKGYFTQAWSLDELVKSGPALKKDLLATHNAELQAIVDRAIKADPKLVVTVDDVAETILSRLLNSQGQVELDETTSDLGISPMASAVNRRSLDWLDKDVFDKYKEKDLVKIMSSYVSTMVKRAEYTDRFGRGGTRLRTAADEAVLEEIGGDELVNEAHTKLPKAIEEWRDQLSRGIEAAMPTLRGVGEVAFAAKKGKDVLEAARTKALKKLGPSFKAVMALEGTLGSDIKQGMRTFNSWMMTYQNVRLLSTSLFVSFSDTVGLVLNGGELGDAWDGFVRGIREIKLRWQDDKSQDLKAIRAEMWGTVDAGSSLDALGQTYGGMWMIGTARRMSNSLFKWNGMEAWNRAMRITATSVAERIIKEFKEKGFDKHDKAAVARFEELFGRGFKPEDIKLDATGELDSTDSKNQAAVSRWVNGAILRPNAAQRTVWGSDPHFQMIWHMKQFTYTFQNVILGKVIEQAKLGNYRPAMVMMAGYTPVIIAADAIKEMLIPGDEPPWMKGGLAGLIQHGVDKAGLLGIGQMGYDAMASDYGAGLTGPAVSQLLHVPMDDPSRTALGALPFGNLARRMAND